MNSLVKFSHPTDLKSIITASPRSNLFTTQLFGLNNEEVEDVKFLILREFEPLAEFYELSNSQLSFLVNTIVSFDDRLKVGELIHIVKNGTIGKYGQNFGKFTPDVVVKWFQGFYEERADMREVVYQEEKKARADINSGMPEQAKEEFSKIVKRLRKKTEKKEWQSMRQWIEESGQTQYQDYDSYKLAQIEPCKKIYENWSVEYKASFEEFLTHMEVLELQKINRK